MLTRSEPVYYVTSELLYGALRKHDRGAHRKSRDASQSNRRQGRKRKTQQPKYVTDATLNFTHDDVARGLVHYHPLPHATGSATILEEEITFVLTAHNAQPVSDSLTVELVPANYDQNALRTVTSPRTGATEVAEARSTSGDDGDKILIAVVAVLTLLTIVGLIVFTCVKCRRAARRKKLELAAVIDGSGSAPAAAGSAVDQHGGAGSDDGRGPPRPPSAARRSAPPPPSLPVIIEPSSTDSGGEASPTASTTAAAAVIPNSPPSRTGYVRVLPPSPPTSPFGAGLQRNGAPSGPAVDGPRSVWKEQVTFDWEHVDPELLQHCRKTNPVLHKNQYWV